MRSKTGCQRADGRDFCPRHDGPPAGGRYHAVAYLAKPGAACRRRRGCLNSQRALRVERGPGRKRLARAPAWRRGSSLFLTARCLRVLFDSLWGQPDLGLLLLLLLLLRANNYSVLRSKVGDEGGRICVGMVRGGVVGCQTGKTDNPTHTQPLIPIQHELDERGGGPEREWEGRLQNHESYRRTLVTYRSLQRRGGGSPRRRLTQGLGTVGRRAERRELRGMDALNPTAMLYSSFPSGGRQELRAMGPVSRARHRESGAGKAWMERRQAHPLPQVRYSTSNFPGILCHSISVRLTGLGMGR